MLMHIFSLIADERAALAQGKRLRERWGFEI